MKNASNTVAMVTTAKKKPSHLQKPPRLYQRVNDDFVAAAATTTDDDDDDDETSFASFDSLQYQDESSCLSCRSFDNIELRLPRRRAPQRRGEGGVINANKKLTTALDVSSEADEDQDGPAEVSGDSNSVYSGGSCSGSFDSNRIELIQLEENDETLLDLTVDCRMMDEESASELFVHLRSNTHLKVLRIICGGKSGSSKRQQDAFCKIVSSLEYNVSIEHIEIIGAIVINREVSGWLAPSLAHNQRVKIISMKKCKFVGSGMAILLVAIQHMKHIRQLKFFSCDWEEHNAETIASSLPYLNLHSLSLVDMNIASDAWPYLFRNIMQSKNLVVLDLSRNQMNKTVLRLLTKSLATTKRTISTLALSSCGLTLPCAKELSIGLREYSSLSSLDISHNPLLTDKGAIYLKDLIKCNRSITNLKVSDCDLSKHSMNAIECGLRYNNSILKSFFSETASQAIFEVVDIIGQFDMLEAVPSFGSKFAPLEAEQEKEESSASDRRQGNRRLPGSQSKQKIQTRNKYSTGQASGSNTARGKENSIN